MLVLSVLPAKMFQPKKYRPKTCAFISSSEPPPRTCCPMDVQNDGYISNCHCEFRRFGIVVFDTSSSSGVEARLVHPIPRVSVTLGALLVHSILELLAMLNGFPLYPLSNDPASERDVGGRGVGCCTA